MSLLDVVPFASGHVDAAGELLAARHTAHRRAEPLLPEGFEEAEAARAEVAAAWRAEGSSGAAGFRDGRLVGYLIGAPREDSAWGANVFIEAAGHAVEQAEDARDLYALAATGWVEQGRPRHYAVVPSTDAALVDAWFRLGFGQQQALAVLQVPTEIEVRVPDSLEIREPREEDIEALLPLDFALPAHQRASPVFSPRPLPTPVEVRAEWRSTIAGNEEQVLIGWVDSRPVACWSICAAERSNDHRGLPCPERAAFLAFAVTLPETRGTGVGVALTDASMALAAEGGYKAMVTDWRVTNLAASRFWPRRGFRTAFVRLYRSIP
jgi:ribosomal protein S18 acetylase RimI-like enzyme